MNPIDDRGFEDANLVSWTGGNFEEILLHQIADMHDTLLAL